MRFPVSPGRRGRTLLKIKKSARALRLRCWVREKWRAIEGYWNFQWLEVAKQVSRTSFSYSVSLQPVNNSVLLLNMKFKICWVLIISSEHSFIIINYLYNANIGNGMFTKWTKWTLTRISRFLLLLLFALSFLFSFRARALLAAVVVELFWKGVNARIDWFHYIVGQLGKLLH